MAAALGAHAGPAAAQPELTFTEPDKLAFALPSDDYKSVWLRSNQAAGPDITWALLVDKGGSTPVTVREAPGLPRQPVLEIQGAKGIAGNSVARYRVRVRGLASGDVKGAQLVARVPRAAPAALDVSISAKSDFSPSIDDVLILPFIVALVLMLIRGGTLDNGFTGPVGTVDLDFSKSFATTLTAIGALLGTILSAGLLDDSTTGISKSGFQALNLTFGVLILVAPLVYLVTQSEIETTTGTPPNTQTVKHYQGRGWALLLASTVTLWAVLGEIVTIYLLLGQIDAAGAVSSTAITIMQGALAIGVLLAILYSWRKLRWIMKTATGGAAPALAGGFLPAGAVAQPASALPSWTPL
jgi:hypothetical protein